MATAFHGVCMFEAFSLFYQADAANIRIQVAHLGFAFVKGFAVAVIKRRLGHDGLHLILLEAPLLAKGMGGKAHWLDSVKGNPAISRRLEIPWVENVWPSHLDRNAKRTQLRGGAFRYSTGHKPSRGMQLGI